MKTTRFKAVWRYSKCCTKKGQVFAQCEANTLKEFVNKLREIYQYHLGDFFCCLRFATEKEILDCYGTDPEDLPEWFKEITGYPVFVFTSSFGEEILCNPTDEEIVRQIASEDYGDYVLKITGIKV